MNVHNQVTQLINSQLKTWPLAAANYAAWTGIVALYHQKQD